MSPRRNPAHADVFVTCSGDCSVKVWDARQPGPTLSIAAHRYEVRRFVGMCMLRRAVP